MQTRRALLCRSAKLASMLAALGMLPVAARAQAGDKGDKRIDEATVA